MRERGAGRMRRPFAALAFVQLFGCSRHHGDAGARGTVVDGGVKEFVWPLAAPDAQEPAPTPRRGMIWIPEGTLIAGTPMDRIPRVADEELGGVATLLHGFYIDEFAYPNEAAAIPKTGVSRDEAAVLCAAQDKRLCTELEWERACKGSGNTIYEYGDTYRPSECATGAISRLVPSGLAVGCKSGFGVHDLHGGPWEWTESAWNRGTAALATTRGGNGESGEIVGRCANGMGRPPAGRRSDVGLRCCAGEPNRVEVNLPVTRGKQLDQRPKEPELTVALERAVMARLPKELPGGLPFRVDRTWLWHPIGNEELILAAGCTRLPAHLVCGVGVFRANGETSPPVMLSFASSGWWMSVVKHHENGRDAWVYGGDQESNFRRRVSYLWGRVAIGEPERRLGAVP
jgi:sulfatase modifying factor 1